MRHQPARAEVREPGGIAFTRHQGIAEAGCAIKYHRRIVQMCEGIVVGLQRIAREGQRVDNLERHNEQLCHGPRLRATQVMPHSMSNRQPVPNWVAHSRWAMTVELKRRRLSPTGWPTVG